LSASGRPQRRRARSGEFLRALTALLVLAALSGGIPILLWRLGGWPLPHSLPSLAELRIAITRSLPDDVIANTLVTLAWVWWAHFLVCLATETICTVRGRMPIRVPGGFLSQAIAARLIGAILFLTPSVNLVQPGAIAAPGPIAAVTVTAVPHLDGTSAIHVRGATQQLHERGLADEHPVLKRYIVQAKQPGAAPRHTLGNRRAPPRRPAALAGDLGTQPWAATARPARRTVHRLRPDLARPGTPPAPGCRWHPIPEASATSTTPTAPASAAQTAAAASPGPDTSNSARPAVDHLAGAAHAGISTWLRDLARRRSGPGDSADRHRARRRRPARRRRHRAADQAAASPAAGPATRPPDPPANRHRRRCRGRAPHGATTRHRPLPRSRPTGPHPRDSAGGPGRS
jgi:hypothetical protein